MKSEADYTLYLVTDHHLPAGKNFEETIAKAIQGGCTLVQLREKEANSGAFYEIAFRVKEITDFYHVPLIINDRADIMLAVDAAGVHAGQSDIPASRLRAMIGPHKILGISARTVEEAVQAESDGADYLGAGAVFPTTTKPDARAVSEEMLRAICKSVHIPVVAIGGIHEKNLPLLEGSGISGVAVVSAVMNAEKPDQAARILKERIYGIL